MTEHSTEAGRLMGTLRSAGAMGIVRVEEGLDAGVDEVWSALTEPGRLSGWLGDVAGDLRPGGEFRARFFASGWEGTGRVEACQRGEHLLLRLQDPSPEPGQPAETVMEVTLTAGGASTQIAVEERGMRPDLLGPYGAGVQIHVENLAAHVAGELGDIEARWDELLPPYQALAAEAAGTAEP